MTITRSTSRNASGGDGSIDTNTHASVYATLDQSKTKSLFGKAREMNDDVAKQDLKRKATDPNLQIIVIDGLWDLTLIVGAPDQSGGQKAFRINSGSLRNASSVWRAMLSGPYRESNMSEIPFPDDSCTSFHLVMQIVHWQFGQLPDKLSQQQLVDLAMLTDKYDLGNVVSIALENKKWLEPYRGTGATWPKTADLQDFTLITKVFNMYDDFEFLANQLAMSIQVDEKDIYFFYLNGMKKVKLRPELPSQIFTHVQDVRNRILQGFLQICKSALALALENKGPCPLKYCNLTKIGILVVELTQLGFCPPPDDASMMYHSVLHYWNDLKEIGRNYQDYSTYMHRLKHVPNNCRLRTCFRDFHILDSARAILKQSAHKDVWAQWEKDNIV